LSLTGQEQLDRCRLITDEIRFRTSDGLLHDVVAKNLRGGLRSGALGCESMRSSVDFPAPLVPSRPKIIRGATRQPHAVRRGSAVFRREAYNFTRFFFNFRANSLIPTKKKKSSKWHRGNLYTAGEETGKLAETYVRIESLAGPRGASRCLLCGSKAAGTLEKEKEF